jgi:hypothetical protein
VDVRIIQAEGGDRGMAVSEAAENMTLPAATL